MAFPVKSQLTDNKYNSHQELGARIAEQIEAEIGPALFKTDPTTGYAGAAHIITTIVACMLKRPLGAKYMTDAALANIVTACTDA